MVNAVIAYAADRADQFDPATKPPATPADPSTRQRWARVLATDAAVFGMPAVLQYAEMSSQAVDHRNPRFTGFGSFSHQRLPADPSFDAFRIPTVDNLYSDAFVDLSGGPAVVHIPPMGARYYTLNLQDAYANATNLSSRTVGPEGGDFALAPPDFWDVPPDGSATRFRVASRYMWILMRISRTLDEPDWAEVNRLQDLVHIASPSKRSPRAALPPADPESVRSDAATFFAALDFVITVNGVPITEVGLTHRYLSIGIGCDSPFVFDTLDEPLRDGLTKGFADALEILEGSRGRAGSPMQGTGWTKQRSGSVRLRLPRPGADQRARPRRQRRSREQAIRRPRRCRRAVAGRRPWHLHLALRDAPAWERHLVPHAVRALHGAGLREPAGALQDRPGCTRLLGRRRRDLDRGDLPRSAHRHHQLATGAGGTVRPRHPHVATLR